MSEIAYVGIGTNIEPRRNRMDAAIKALNELGKLLRVSSIYESEPYGVEEQPRFLNAVAAITTDLTARQLYTALKDLEISLGRQSRQRWHEREIDFDILFFGNTTVDEKDLIIPHADLIHRSFVLIPLAEIAPNIVHPVLRKTVKELSVPFLGADTLRII